MPPGSVEEVGLSLVVLSLVFACAALIRRWTSPLRKLFIPTAVIGGFLVLGLGPKEWADFSAGPGSFQRMYSPSGGSCRACWSP
jgi:ESS family glutamate:Na+ symporter